MSKVCTKVEYVFFVLKFQIQNRHGESAETKSARLKILKRT